MAKENTAGLGVNNRYGPLNTPDGAAGNFRTAGVENELVIEFNGKNINDDDILGFIPAGSTPIEAYMEVKEAFALGGTTPVVEVGTDGSEATNGCTFTEANMESVGTVVNTTFTGTWAARLAADTNVSIVLAGTSPTVTDDGKARVTVRYAKS